jgi:endonuclease/exonuclease/phosphatase family metal-dependent hydrolase
MKLAVRRRAELELVNALYVANHGVDIEVVHEWDLQSRSTENRAAVAVVITRKRGPHSGGGVRAATALTLCTDQAQHATVLTTDAAASFLPTAPTAADGAPAQQQMDAGEQAQEQPIMFVCTHLDAYDEQHRLDQLDHLT